MTPHEHKQKLNMYGELALEDHSIGCEDMESIRRLLCLSRQELADYLGITYTRIYQMETTDGCGGSAAAAIGLLCRKPRSIPYIFGPDKTAEIREAYDLPFDLYQSRDEA